jgi:hypothetical protein
VDRIPGSAKNNPIRTINARPLIPSLSFDPVQP